MRQRDNLEDGAAYHWWEKTKHVWQLSRHIASATDPLKQHLWEALSFESTSTIAHDTIEKNPRHEFLSDLSLLIHRLDDSGHMIMHIDARCKHDHWYRSEVCVIHPLMQPSWSSPTGSISINIHRGIVPAHRFYIVLSDRNCQMMLVSCLWYQLCWLNCAAPSSRNGSEVTKTPFNHTNVFL